MKKYMQYNISFQEILFGKEEIIKKFNEMVEKSKIKMEYHIGNNSYGEVHEYIKDDNITILHNGLIIQDINDNNIYDINNYKENLCSNKISYSELYGENLYNNSYYSSTGNGYITEGNGDLICYYKEKDKEKVMTLLKKIHIFKNKVKEVKVNIYGGQEYVIIDNIKYFSEKESTFDKKYKLGTSEKEKKSFIKKIKDLNIFSDNNIKKILKLKNIKIIVTNN